MSDNAREPGYGSEIEDPHQRQVRAEEKAQEVVRLITAQNESIAGFLKETDEYEYYNGLEAQAARDEWLIQNGAPFSIAGPYPVAFLCKEWWKVAFKPDNQTPWNDRAFRATAPVQERTRRYDSIAKALQSSPC